MTQNPYPGSPPGIPNSPGNYQVAPDTNLVWAILATLFCCLPLGIVSIVKASQVTSLWAQGQYDAARKASEDAKKFALWSVGAGLAVAVLYVVVIAGGLA